MIYEPELPYDLFTADERRALMRIPTHDANGNRIAEWERLYLATSPR